MHTEVLTDHALACRLERTEAAANARFVEARARVSPEIGERGGFRIAYTRIKFELPRH